MHGRAGRSARAQTFHRLLHFKSSYYTWVQKSAFRKGVCNIHRACKPTIIYLNSLGCACVQVASVYFHSVDYVLGRKPERDAWRVTNHLPRILFPNPNLKRQPKANRKVDYPFFKRMLATKDVVFSRHHNILRLYQLFCKEAELPPWVLL